MDPTPGSLEVFLRDPGLLIQATTASVDSVEEGIWIKADPVPGCILCNIGDSECASNWKCCCYPEGLTCLDSVGDMDERDVQEYDSQSRSYRDSIPVRIAAIHFSLRYLH